MKFVSGQTDRKTRRLLDRFVGAVGIHNSRSDIVAIAPIDMLYCVQLLSEVFGEHDSIRAVLDDKPDGEWFDD